MAPLILPLAMSSSDGLSGHLPEGGLARSAVHEFRAPEATAVHVIFAVLLLAEQVGTTPILWVSTVPSAYPPGLARLGLDPARCLFAQARNDAESLGTLEVALRGGMTGVAEADDLSRLAARRLALAAKQGGGIGFLLRHVPAFTPLDSTAPATRWLITPARGGTPGEPQLRVELLYAKGGRPGVFFFEIKKEAEDDSAPLSLALVAGRHDTKGQFRRTG